MNDMSPGESVLILIVLLLLAPFGIWGFQLLWNITMPQVFSLNTITFWESLRLLVLSMLLFGFRS